MPAFNLKNDGDELVENIRQQTWFPYKTGNLRDNATMGEMMPIAENEIYRIRFDSTIAPYIGYLEEGKFRRKKDKTVRTVNFSRMPSGFGVQFHISQDNAPSAVKFGKHMGFISDKTINYILNYFVNKYKGEVKWT